MSRTRTRLPASLIYLSLEAAGGLLRHPAMAVRVPAGDRGGGRAGSGAAGLPIVVAGAGHVLLAGTVVVFGLTASFPVALGCFWLVSLLREVREPVFTAWLNRGLDPRTRATVNSIGGQADAVGQVAGGPSIGVVTVALGVPAALVAAGLLRAPALALYARGLRHETPTEGRSA